jgi:hypothetical protein
MRLSRCKLHFGLRAAINQQGPGRRSSVSLTRHYKRSLAGRCRGVDAFHAKSGLAFGSALVNPFTADAAATQGSALSQRRASNTDVHLPGTDVTREAHTADHARRLRWLSPRASSQTLLVIRLERECSHRAPMTDRAEIGLPRVDRSSMLRSLSEHNQSELVHQGVGAARPRRRCARREPLYRYPLCKNVALNDYR